MRALFVLIALVLPALPAMAQDWALEGFDPVGYVRQGQAVPGRSEIATMWKGKLWHFSSEENRARFEADPHSYAPGFAGHCPVALSEGRKEAGDPHFFLMVENRLYLTRSAQARRQMQQDSAAVLTRAAQVWKALR